jgi:Raf kinase inhibitor-like YbhB/YbcL family protein
MKISSPAFAEGASIPAKYTCDSENVSPPLEWADVPADTKSLAVIVEDPDAPSGLFVHWLLYDIPPKEKGLTEGVGVAGPKSGGGTQGKNGFGKIAYGGPCPPSGTHRYYFHLYALSAATNLPAGASREQLQNAMHNHVLQHAELMGRYARAKK